MKKTSSGQLELFRTHQENTQSQPQVPDSFIHHIRAYEKIVLIIIGFIITGIISFSLGVKKGQTTYKVSVKPQLQQPLAEVNQIKIQKEKGNIQTQSYYTIQVASFLKKENAQKEAEKLKKNGLSPSVLPKGKFNIVCVGNFSKRQEAESLLSKLKRQYNDSQIRRL